MAAGRASIRVRYADTDAMGVAYHANYFVWFEVGRCELLRQQGWSYREMEESGVRLPVIAASGEFVKPARYDEELEVRSTATLLSPVRIAFDYEIVRQADDTLLARGRTVHAAVDARGRPCRLPERARTLLS
jgi:acyl-CoA thioester hydrolase